MLCAIAHKKGHVKNQIVFEDEAGTFTVSVFHAVEPSRTVIFAVGAGGDPRRHTPLLNMLAEQGLTVVAPHFERLTSQIVRASELALRFQRIARALNYAERKGQPIVALGHSIGSAMLIGLAGGRIRMHDGTGLEVQTDKRIQRLVTFTPAMDFFKAPGALDEVATPIQVWAGSLDSVTPPSQSVFLKTALGLLVDARFVEGAGHFSFMNELPPHVSDTLENREIFFVSLAREVGKFLLD